MILPLRIVARCFYDNCSHRHVYIYIYAAYAYLIWSLKKRRKEVGDGWMMYQYIVDMRFTRCLVGVSVRVKLIFKYSNLT